MKYGLLNYIDEHIKSKNRYFCYKDKYRTWSWSYREIYQHARQFAGLLQSLDIGKGNRVLLKGPNCPEWVAVFIGCLICGVVVVPIDVKSDSDFEEMVQKKVRAKLLVCPRGDKIKFLKLKSIYFEDLERCLSSVPCADNLSYFVNSNDLAEIVFTSGTKSTPKGVMITHGNIEANLKSIQPVIGKYKKMFHFMFNLKILSLVPLSHMYGQMIGIFIPLMISSSVVFMSNQNPHAVIKTIREEKIWILGLLPKFMEILKNYIISKPKLDSEKFMEKYQRMKTKRWQLRLWAFRNIHLKLGWRLVAIMVGGATLDGSVDEFWRCLAYCMFQGYGLTETAPLITLADSTQTGPGSIGKVLTGQQIRLVNNEILVKGANVSPGYYKDSLKTKKAFAGSWFKTGDLAEIDRDGNIFFKGRKDDIIIRSDGVNIYPEDIESAVKALNLVKDCAVIGLKHKNFEEIHAVLLLSKEAGDNPGEIIHKANKHLSAQQHIDSYSIWNREDFPRTSTMKIKKNELAEVIKAGGTESEERKISSGKTSAEIYEILKSFHKVEKKDIKLEAKLEDDLGLDSLDMIQLSCAVEDKYNIEMYDSYISRETSVGDIEKLIKSPPEVSYRLPFFSFPYWRPVCFVRTIFQYILYPFISVLYKRKVYGKENLKNLKTPFVLAVNHSSNMDTFAILYSLPLRLRQRITVMMSIEYHFNHFFYHKGLWPRRFIEAVGFYLLVNLAINTCPLSRTHGFKQIMENIGGLLNKGWSVLIYPEGRVTADGKIKKFESGVGIIASDMKVPVVPARIYGLFDILHHGILPVGHLPKRPLAAVKFGKPLTFRGENYREITEKIEKAVRSL
jgi:long-chain acyl-CoA synthetase